MTFDTALTALIIAYAIIGVLILAMLTVMTIWLIRIMKGE